jgi:hypothetical protein
MGSGNPAGLPTNNDDWSNIEQIVNHVQQNEAARLSLKTIAESSPLEQYKASGRVGGPAGRYG